MVDTCKFAPEAWPAGTCMAWPALRVRVHLEHPGAWPVGTSMFAPETWPVGTYMPSAWSASIGKRGASAYASCARQVGTSVNVPEALGLTGRSTHGVEHKADSVGLPLLSSIPTCFGRTSTTPCTFPVGSLAATLPDAWGWPQVKDPTAWFHPSRQQCTQE